MLIVILLYTLQEVIYLHVLVMFLKVNSIYPIYYSCLSVYYICWFCFQLSSTLWVTKVDLTNIADTFPNLGRFSKFFFCSLNKHFPSNPLLYLLPLPSVAYTLSVQDANAYTVCNTYIRCKNNNCWKQHFFLLLVSNNDTFDNEENGICNWQFLPLFTADK